jgi:hypothetical protein
LRTDKRLQICFGNQKIFLKEPSQYQMWLWREFLRFKKILMARN